MALSNVDFRLQILDLERLNPAIQNFYKLQSQISNRLGRISRDSHDR